MQTGQASPTISNTSNTSNSLAGADAELAGGRAPFDQRIAGAPISWGVCQVPRWGWQLDSEQVVSEMVQAGLAVTELGPEGFLPADPDVRSTTLSHFGLHDVGGLVPVLLHEPDHDPLPGLAAELPAFVASGAGTVVLAAAIGREVAYLHAVAASLPEGAR